MRWFSRRRRVKFDSPAKPIDALFRELAEATGTKVSRKEALSVPAFRRGRNQLCSIATMPLEQVDLNNEVEVSPLLSQIDPDIPNVVTIAQTVEDLLCEGISWWEVTARDFAGFPVAATHLDVTAVTVEWPSDRQPAPLPSDIDPREPVVWVEGQPVPASRVIRFDSPNPAVLKHAGREIKRAILLDKAASMYADDPRPSDYFTPADGAEVAEDDDIKDILNKWKAARKKRATAWIPLSMQYHTVDSPAPRDLQLVELQRQAALDIANALGIDPEDLGISTTSRTYSNDVDRRRNKLNDVLKPYMRAITDRLSMGDVTRRGHTVRFNTAEYLQPNPTDRWAVYEKAKNMGVITDEEIRKAEGMPPLPEVRPGPDSDVAPGDASDLVPESGPEAGAVDSDRPASMRFDESSTFTLDVPVQEFSVDRENRIIEGLAVPYGEYGSKGGLTFRFDTDSMQWDAENPGRVKLVFPRHGEAVGRAIQLRNTRGGLLARFKVGRGAEGDRALESAEDGVFDGLSVGVDFDAQADTVPDPKRKGALLVQRSDLRHVALTDEPVFNNARVTRVAASRTQGGGHVPDTDTTEASVTAPETPTPQPTPEPVAQTFSAEQIAQIEALLAQTERPAVVDPTRRVTLDRVSEPASYRFDRKGDLVPGAHDFGIDFVRAVNPNIHDQAAYARVMEFVQAQFDVVSTDVNELNPTINLPRYIDQREFVYPIYNSVSRGAPPNGIQPFSWPKFASASGWVAAHTEGVEPTGGAYVTTNQTVTPAPLSGKGKITREVWDMGGTPGIGDLIWRRVVRDWYETIEARIVTMLDAASPTSLGSFTVGGGTGHATLVQEMRRFLALLQFVRGGFRFDVAFAEAGLYTHLADSFDTTGRPFFPQVNPQNADGDSVGRWATLNVGGVPFLPAWALGATVGTTPDSSYLIDRTAVDCWSTPPSRLIFDETEVAHVYLGVWGYSAEAINDLAGVREIIYDPA